MRGWSGHTHCPLGESRMCTGPHAGSPTRRSTLLDDDTVPTICDADDHTAESTTWLACLRGDISSFPERLKMKKEARTDKSRESARSEMPGACEWGRGPRPEFGSATLLLDTGAWSPWALGEGLWEELRLYCQPPFVKPCNITITVSFLFEDWDRSLFPKTK